jgi:hypothetical protein
MKLIYIWFFELERIRQLKKIQKQNQKRNNLEDDKLAQND